MLLLLVIPLIYYLTVRPESFRNFGDTYINPSFDNMPKDYPSCMKINGCPTLTLRPEFLTFLNGLKGLNVYAAKIFIHNRAPEFNVIIKPYEMRHQQDYTVDVNTIQLYHDNQKILKFIAI